MTAELRALHPRATPPRHQLLVDGEPFIVLGAQIHNSSSWPEALDRAWPQLVALGANTAEVPVSWEQLEPAPGAFDFSLVDHALAGARAHGLRLVLLWFGTWKNGVADYVPRWVKDDPATYPPMRDPAGAPVRVLSPHAAATRDADARAFAALMRHLRAVDAERGTVIMVQVENEPGSLFTDRDYGSDAERAFRAPVPAEVAALLAPGRPAGASWPELLGAAAGEAFQAYHVARYVNAVAEAGRAEHAVPLSVNAWLKERKGFMRPGVEYPSGVPVSHLLDLWKHAAPAVDVIAPDIYVLDYVGYREVCAAYARPDNALLIPETGGTTPFAGYLFYALGDFGAVGWAPFGVDRSDGSTELDPRLFAVRDSFHLLRPAVAELARLQAAGALRAAVEQQHLANVLLSFDGVDALVEFGPLAPGYGGLAATGTPGQTGRALLGRRGPREFLVAGFDARVTFRATDAGVGEARFAVVEEGAFEDGAWVARRRLNGDQTFFGLRLPATGAMLRVEL